MNKYLFDPKSKETNQNKIFCIDDYGVEGEILPNKWYDILNETNLVYYLKNEWGEIETYSKMRFRVQKENIPIFK
jgi:hypothetical protein